MRFVTALVACAALVAIESRHLPAGKISLTGAVLASSSLHEEQQKPSEVLRGSVREAGSRAAAVAAPIAALAGARALSAAHAAGPALEKARFYGIEVRHVEVARGVECPGRKRQRPSVVEQHVTGAAVRIEAADGGLHPANVGGSLQPQPRHVAVGGQEGRRRRAAAE